MRHKVTTQEECRELLRKAFREYTTQSDADDDRTLAIKRAIRHLQPSEQALFILYNEIESYRQIAQIFGVSRTTVLNEIKVIKAKIRKEIRL